MKLPEKIDETLKFLLNKGVKCDAAVILGTGLGNDFISNLTIEQEIPYTEIPHFPKATVEFHQGKLIYGKTGDKHIIAFQGRFHFYEGYSMEEITYPVRIARALNAKFLLLSNAAGCLNTEWEKGELMLIDDHINLLPDNPLIGENYDELGPRFTDMSAPYNALLNENALKIADDLDITLRRGVYTAVMGPMLETRAEYRFLKIIGTDAVGMSTVPEVIAAMHAGLPVCAISVLTDECDPDNLQPVNVPEIIEIAGKVEPDLTKIFIKIILETNADQLH